MDTDKNQSENNDIKAEELTSEAMEAAAGGGGFMETLEKWAKALPDVPGCIFGSHDIIPDRIVSSFGNNTVEYRSYRCSHCSLRIYYKCIGDQKIRISEDEFNNRRY